MQAYTERQADHARESLCRVPPRRATAVQSVAAGGEALLQSTMYDIVDDDGKQYHAA